MSWKRRKTTCIKAVFLGVFAKNDVCYIFGKLRTDGQTYFWKPLYGRKKLFRGNRRYPGDNSRYPGGNLRYPEGKKVFRAKKSLKNLFSTTLIKILKLLIP